MQKLFTIAAILLSVTGAGVFHTVSAQEVETIEFFSDLNEDSLIGQAAANLREAGVIAGYGDGTFRPEQAVNRAELAKFLLLAKGRMVKVKHNNGRFPDVKEGEWYVRYVIDAADLGIIAGYPGGNFKPAQTVNTAEFLKMLSKAFELPENLVQDFADVDSAAWFAPFVGNVPELDLLPARDPAFLEPGREMSRGEVAVALYRVLRPKMEENQTTSSSSGSQSSGAGSLLVSAVNENPQLTMTYTGKNMEPVLPLNVSVSKGSATIKSLQLRLSSAQFLDQLWVKSNGEKNDANRVRITVPVVKTITAGEKALVEVFASVQEGLVRGDNVKVFLEKIEWEQNGKTYSQDFSVDGYELMIF